MTTALEPIPQRGRSRCWEPAGHRRRPGHPRDHGAGRQLGPIFRLELPGGDIVFLSSQELVDEVCDESRFDKALSGALLQVRDFAGDGLFTSWTEEANWGKAHRILMPAFGPAALRQMFDGMVDIADQLLLKWERQGPNHLIDVADNTTR